MADKVFRRIGTPVPGSSALWFSTSLAGGILRDEFFGVPAAPPSGSLSVVSTTGSPQIIPGVIYAGVTGTTYRFTNSGTITFSGTGTVHYLLVGGGGPGGAILNAGSGGGGGGGDFVPGSSVVSSGIYAAIVGPGGIRGTATGTSDTNPTNGGTSSFNGVDAIGGGYGASFNSNGDIPASDGASGGGGSDRAYPAIAFGGDALGVNGDIGGGVGSASDFNGAGGGGAGGSGGAAGPSFDFGGGGGPGNSSDITGTVEWYCGGGGGASFNTPGAGGIGGGGKGLGGSSLPDFPATSGAPNTGGGGGGGRAASEPPGNGGSGVVIIFVPEASPSGGSNPSTIMGANVLWYADVATSGLWQNGDGTGAVTDGSAVRRIDSIVGPNSIAGAIDREVVYRENGGNPYLEGDTGSQFRATLSRTGSFYAIMRFQYRGTGTSQDTPFIIASDTSTYYSNANWTSITLNAFLDPPRARMEGGSGTEPSFMTNTVSRNTWHTVEIYCSDTLNAIAIDGGSFVTASRSGFLGDTSYFDLFNGTESGAVHPDSSIWFRRGAILNTIPDNTQRTALLTWATDGDTGSGPSTTGYISVWDGAAWVKKPVKYWDGAAWVTKPIKYWNGSVFVSTN